MLTSSKKSRVVFAPLAVAGVVMTLCVTGAAPALAEGHRDGGKQPKSVIFIMGDGMGPAHREAGRLHLQGLDGSLAMDSLPVTGYSETSPDDPKAVVTDSAAGASAWSTGVSTYNGAIAVAPDGTPLPFLGQQAKEAGKATGLVTTSQVTDASPAAFFSSVPDRDEQSEIAKQYLEVSKPDVILGGGEDRWLPEGQSGAFPDTPAADPTEKSAGTEGDLVAEAQGLGYDYVTSAADLEASDSDKLLGLFSNEEMFQQKAEGKGDVYDPVVPLPDMTSKALDVLSKDDDGFFLFVEEEAIDEFSHANNGAQMLKGMDQLDKTVAVAQAYVKEHPDTLLVVTADHECGGLTIENPDAAGSAADESGAGGTYNGTAGDTTSGEDGPFSVPGRRRPSSWTGRPAATPGSRCRCSRRARSASASGGPTATPPSTASWPTPSSAEATAGRAGHLLAAAPASAHGVLAGAAVVLRPGAGRRRPSRGPRRRLPAGGPTAAPPGELGDVDAQDAGVDECDQVGEGVRGGWR